MMKRYASHYLYLPGYGFLWHYVVQMHENCVEALFPMSDEIESTEWQPGVIALVPLEADVSALSFNSKDILSEVPVEVVECMSCLVPVLLFPFDFTRMEPVSETRHKLLQ